MTEYTPAQLEAWAAISTESFVDCLEAMRNLTLPVTAAPDLARLVLERDAEIARLTEQLERSKAWSHEMWQALQEYAPPPTPEDFEWARATALAIASRPLPKDEIDE